MDSISHQLAIWTLVAVLVEAAILVPTMIREITQIFTKRYKRTLREIFDKNGPSYPSSTEALLEKTKIKRKCLLDALYELRESGEITLTPGGWAKTPEGRR